MKRISIIFHTHTKNNTWMLLAQDRITKLKKDSRKLVGGVMITKSTFLQRRHINFYIENTLQNPNMHTWANK